MRRVDISFVRNRLKQFFILALVLAVSLVPANPAVAQVTQSNEQEVESGDSTQDFNATGGGENSNECVGIQGVSNTGNATNTTSIEQYEARDGEFETDGSGNFKVSPSSTTICDQQVNQAALASSTSTSCGPVWWGDAWHCGNGTQWLVRNGSALVPWTNASDAVTGALDGAGALATLGVLGTLGLVGTGLIMRRTGRRD